MTARASACPPLGEMPLERYVLTRWLSTADSDGPDVRRRKLAQEFIAMGWAERCRFVQQMPSEADRPPESEWAAILSPLRTAEQRQLACSGSGVLWLRTDYDCGSENLYDHVTGKLNVEIALDHEANILNDKTLYNYGVEWDRIFQVLPEMLLEVPMTASEAATSLQYPDSRDEQLCRSRPSYFDAAEQPQTFNFDTFREVTNWYHFWSTYGYIFVVDRIGLSKLMPLVVFYDDRGRVVREARVPPEACEGLAGAWHEGEHNQSPEFSDADVGLDYLPGGVCGPRSSTINDRRKCDAYMTSTVPGRTTAKQGHQLGAE